MKWSPEAFHWLKEWAALKAKQNVLILNFQWNTFADSNFCKAPPEEQVCFFISNFQFKKVYIFNLILKYKLFVARSTKKKNALTTMNAALDQYGWRKTLQESLSRQTQWKEKKLETEKNEFLKFIHEGKIYFI
jgi:hypothetical protein